MLWREYVQHLEQILIYALTTQRNAHTVCYVRAILKCLLLAWSFSSKARGSTFSNTPIYFMTSLQRRSSFSSALLGGLITGTKQSDSKDVKPQKN